MRNAFAYYREHGIAKSGKKPKQYSRKIKISHQGASSCNGEETAAKATKKSHDFSWRKQFAIDETCRYGRKHRGRIHEYHSKAEGIDFNRPEVEVIEKHLAYQSYRHCFEKRF